MKAMRLHAVNDFRLDEIEKPVPRGEEILVKIGACGICGSDIPRVFELGTRVYPVALGHEFSGTVVEVGDEKNRDLTGKRAAVFPLIPCRQCPPCKIGSYCQCENYDYLGSRSNGGFAEYCLVPSRWHLVFSENPDVDLEELCMVEPICVAQHAIRRGDLHAGENIVILGAGPIGILTARWARIFGAGQVILTDIDEVKAEFARERGFTVINSMKEDCVARIHEMTGGRGADVVIEGTGTSSGINTAIECVRVGGRVVMLGNPHKDTTIALNNHSLLLRKELVLSGVWNSYYEEFPINEWKYTVHMLDTGRLQAADLITHRSGLDDLGHLFEQIHSREITICKAVYSARLDEK